MASTNGTSSPAGIMDEVALLDNSAYSSNSVNKNPRTASSSPVTLDQLPEEVLYHIATFLDPADVIRGLMETNKHLHRIFASDEYWRVRIKHRWPFPYPIISGNSNYGFNFCTRNNFRTTVVTWC